jgi:hypothetical protein
VPIAIKLTWLFDPPHAQAEAAKVDAPSDERTSPSLPASSVETGSSEKNSEKSPIKSTDSKRALPPSPPTASSTEGTTARPQSKRAKLENHFTTATIMRAAWKELTMVVSGRDGLPLSDDSCEFFNRLLFEICKSVADRMDKGDDFEAAVKATFIGELGKHAMGEADKWKLEGAGEAVKTFYEAVGEAFPSVTTELKSKFAGVASYSPYFL